MCIQHNLVALTSQQSGSKLILLFFNNVCSHWLYQQFLHLTLYFKMLTVFWVERSPLLKPLLLHIKLFPYISSAAAVWAVVVVERQEEYKGTLVVWWTCLLCAYEYVCFCLHDHSPAESEKARAKLRQGSAVSLNSSTPNASRKPNSSPHPLQGPCQLKEHSSMLTNLTSMLTNLTHSHTHANKEKCMITKSILY